MAQAQPAGNGFWHKLAQVKSSPQLPAFGDCNPFCDRKKLKGLVPAFLEAYRAKPLRKNLCGCLLNHCMINFMIASLSNATFIVENGVDAGMSGYMYRKAQPAAEIWHIDPAPEACDASVKRWINPSKAHYLTGKDFVDFFDVNWEQAGVDKKRSLVLFDTHLPDFFNIIKAVSRGFSTFVVDDNYPTVDPGTMGGLSLKTVMGAGGDKQKQIIRALDWYYEMPPLINPLLVPRKLAKKYPRIFTVHRFNTSKRFGFELAFNQCTKGRHCQFVIDAEDLRAGVTQAPLLDLFDPADAELFEKIADSGIVREYEWWAYNHMAVLGTNQR